MPEKVAAWAPVKCEGPHGADPEARHLCELVGTLAAEPDAWQRAAPIRAPSPELEPGSHLCKLPPVLEADFLLRSGERRPHEPLCGTPFDL